MNLVPHLKAESAARLRDAGQLPADLGLALQVLADRLPGRAVVELDGIGQVRTARGRVPLDREMLAARVDLARLASGDPQILQGRHAGGEVKPLQLGLGRARGHLLRAALGHGAHVEVVDTRLRLELKRALERREVLAREDPVAHCPRAPVELDLDQRRHAQIPDPVINLDPLLVRTRPGVAEIGPGPGVLDLDRARLVGGGPDPLGLVAALVPRDRDQVQAALNVGQAPDRLAARATRDADRMQLLVFGPIEQRHRTAQQVGVLGPPGQVDLVALPVVSIRLEVGGEQQLRGLAVDDDPERRRVGTHRDRRVVL